MMEDKIQALLKSEEQLRFILENSPDAAYRRDLRTDRYDYISPVIEAITGYTVDEMTAISTEIALDLIHPEDRSAIVEQMKKAADTGKLMMEYRFRCKSGDYRWLADNFTFVKDENGCPLYFVGVVRDITERKTTDEKLRQNEERFNLAMKVVHEGIWDSNLETNAVFYSPGYIRMLGYTEDEIEPNVSAWNRLMHPDDWPRANQHLEAVLRGERKYEIEFRLRHKDGHYVDILSRGYPVRREPNGPIVRIVGTHFDITERKQVEEALRISENRFKTLFTTINEGFYLSEIIYDESGKPFDYRYIEVNPAYEQIIGLGRDQIIGKRYKELIPNHSPQWVDVFIHVAMTGIPANFSFFLEAFGRHFEAFAFKPVEGQFAVVLNDITERKQVEETLRKADRGKDEFLAVLSHELRNPLASICNSLYILDHAATGNEQTKQAREIINRQTGQLVHLVDDLLDLTRITQNKIRLKLERLELNDLVQRTVEDHHMLFEQNGIGLETDSTASSVFVQGDPTRLAQVVGNLLVNAVKFTDRGGEVHVSVETDEFQQAIIRVADTGIGLAPEILISLFEPFKQADMALDRSRGGLGLGLALVKDLVELHGGKVSVSSAGPGKGSEFMVRIPLDAAVPDKPKTDLPTSPPSSRRILVIDDNEDVANSLSAILKVFHHDVEVAANGPEGITKAYEFRPDVLLCDIGMPGMDGYAVARAFRADPRLKSLVLVALTGYGMPGDIQKAAAAGFDRQLIKPPDLNELLQIVDQIPKAEE